jgi:hypothetical protein
VGEVIEPEPPQAPAPAAVQQRMLRLWRPWFPVSLLALFGGFGAPHRLVPLFQVLIVVTATVPLVRGMRLLDGADLSPARLAQLRRLMWLLAAPLYLVVVALFFRP